MQEAEVARFGGAGRSLAQFVPSGLGFHGLFHRRTICRRPAAAFEMLPRPAAPMTEKPRPGVTAAVVALHHLQSRARRAGVDEAGRMSGGNSPCGGSLAVLDAPSAGLKPTPRSVCHCLTFGSRRLRISKDDRAGRTSSEDVALGIAQCRVNDAGRASWERVISCGVTQAVARLFGTAYFSSPLIFHQPRAPYSMVSRPCGWSDRRSPANGSDMGDIRS